MTIKDLKEQGLIIFEAISGSRAYGTDLPTSDTDIRGVFVCPHDAIMSDQYVDQVNDKTNDITYYEVGKFLQLVRTNNPNILELLNVPEECILHKDPIFDIILADKAKFISKQCRNSFGGYAVQQIKKARGLNKKIVNPVEKERKNPLDFCYAIGAIEFPGGSEPLTKYLEDKDIDQSECGLTVIPHARDLYALYHPRWNNFTAGNASFKGILNDDKTSNELRLSSVPKGIDPLIYVSYNKDGYSTYCKDYKEYWDWVAKRNPERYENNVQHGKNYDSKNLMHCHRLLDMSLEILEGKGIIVRRPNREELLAIRKGEKDYDELVEEAEAKIKLMDKLFEESELPNTIDKYLIPALILKTRAAFYKQKQN